MELRHLRYFAAVAGTCHFGRAAEQLHMAQPPLSQAIRQLESELGVELLTRTTRQVALTDAGSVFHADVRRILASVDESVARVRRFAQGAEGVLRIGLTGSAAYRQLPRMARLVKETMPGVDLEIHTELLTPAQESALDEGRLDVGVLRPPTRTEGIAHRVIVREPLVVVVPEGHWLGERDAVPVECLRGEDFVLYAASSRSVVNDAVSRACLTAGFYPHVAHEVHETSTALALVSAGLGITVMPDSVRSAAREGVVCVPLEHPGSPVHGVFVELALAWRERDTSPLLRTFLDVMAAHRIFGEQLLEETP
ncbi:LysR family transcriptional regulator [Streptomyces antnestii]|uniref:LysR family transcriptional regulator n=1 Tax=Streptomyces antnestii TaxID=2494256 RepID=A0A3S2W4H8_9ACTN|nr:LysR substrate-binding domain-containing protein [Streptomyces sp. San01]RVU27733.1 LysR family transcriptional regulator [Streptomyces sp. San01]